MLLTIGLSYAPDSIPKYGKYREALEKAAAALDHTIETINLFDDITAVDRIDGIIFTGGSDMNPSRYGKPDEAIYCPDIDEERDSREFEIFERVSERALPTLAVCRGVQLLNVLYGGTLVTDIVRAGGIDHKKLDPTTDRRHPVHLVRSTYLARIVGKSNGEINSAHHQAIERLGIGFTVNATSPDGIIEGFEWQDPTGKPFLMGVQWHPERMDYDEAFSGRIFEAFLWEVAAHKTLSKRMGVLSKQAAAASSQPETRV